MRFHGTWSAIIGACALCFIGYATAATLAPNIGSFGPRGPSLDNMGPRSPDMSAPRSDPTIRGSPTNDGSSPTGKGDGGKSGGSNITIRKLGGSGGSGGGKNSTGRLARGINLPPSGERRYEPDKIVMELADSLSDQAIETLLRRNRLARVESLNLRLTNTRWFVGRILDGRAVPDVLRGLSGAPGVLTAQPSYRVVLQQQPETASPMTGVTESEQYTVTKLHLAQAHSVAKGDKVAVAIIDSGIDTTHPELQGVIAESYDALGSTEPAHSHGTAIAGAIVAHAKLTGVAPAAHILAIRAFGVSGSSAESTTFTVLKSLDWAASHSARVVNMSFAGPFDPAVGRALTAVRQKGIVLVAAMGNAGPKSPPLFPAADANVIAVTATDADDRLFAASNRGKHVALAAPGVDILLPALGGAYQMSSGTSFAAAHVSGIVALLLERKPGLTPDDVRQILQSTAKDLGPKGRDDQFGFGLVDAYQAVLTLEPHSVGSASPVNAPGR